MTGLVDTADRAVGELCAAIAAACANAAPRHR
jgi:hypothetical protein